MPARKTTSAKGARGGSAGSRARGGASAKRGSAGRGRQPSAGISRIDQDSTRTHGYFVRFDYRRTDEGWRPRHKAFFGDVSNGGRSGALKAAEEWLASVQKGGGGGGGGGDSRKGSARKGSAKKGGARKGASKKGGASKSRGR
ncbi:MAG TPA: hypothetical protein VKA84_09970 [Gemmatimonadaceae bacterium]|nr:hypothetical protein [Gemmatimonadaceae bacterium]